MAVYNFENTEWKAGEYQLFLGQEPALHDSINRPYQEVFDLYKLQKSIDWSEDEVNLEQSRLDLINASKNNYDIMIKNLAFQWELDSVASRAIAPLLAPFVTNSELWAWYSKVSEIEVLHALTYSEIIRQCIPDPEEAISEAMRNMEVVKRATAVAEALNQVEEVGAKLTLGIYTKEDEIVRDTVVLAVAAIYLLERLEFMASFAATFGQGEQGVFQGICKLVQKIANDEQLHFRGGEVVLDIMFRTGWADDFKRNEQRLNKLYSDVVEQELSWDSYLFSEGRNIVGLNKSLLDDWVLYNAGMAASHLRINNPYPVIDRNPLPWMENWLDINKFQNANQESDNTNYTLNTVVNDLDDSEELDF